MTARWKMQKQKPEKHVIIIGAGPAGLTAAYQLLKRGGCSVTVVEATDKIGGISRTDSFNGNRMDLGGHRFFSKSEEVTKFWEELMPLQGSPSYDDMLTGPRGTVVAGRSRSRKNGPGHAGAGAGSLGYTSCTGFLTILSRCRHPRCGQWDFATHSK